ncbi:MAG TPA: beta-eliminating lyase-related protein [Thermomonas sp.]|jgi:threonine aldolase|nr:beta-eliminating lyase-related protein [Thermomonas sp.]HOU65998.1 beta-eliminating lyase-related protein [Thermomonas sp.]HOZ23748.1 beta-eliminating lyase-related protein [Thermomonas sp.]HPM55965.1 beta-eliminating lyase-related protein [Thermomonas sp.]HPW11570.1 beta-eliminating lyase-related protein [Thermomonas sp.]
MDRRTFLQGSLVAAVAAAMPGEAEAQSAAAPAFPPIDARSVWLVGDDAPPDPVAMTTRLAELARTHPEVRDRYQQKGAVEALERAFATLLGKEDCAFFATGTLANHVAVRVLCGEHRRALVQQESHLYRDESDAAQRLSGINLVPLAAGRASPSLDEVRAAIDASENGPYPLKIGAVSLESPVRRVDGEMLPLALVRDIASLARAHGARLHLDGARLLLARPDLDIPAYAAPFDTVYVSLYKYLGAPFGAVLAGSKAEIAEARDLRHVFGGGLYQAWMSAVLALDALPAFRQQIGQAHARVRKLIDALVASGRARERSAAEASNIFWLEMPQALAEAAFERGRQAGIRVGRWQDGRIPLHANTTILRRPLEDYLGLFGG